MEFSWGKTAYSSLGGTPRFAISLYDKPTNQDVDITRRFTDCK